MSSTTSDSSPLHLSELHVEDVLRVRRVDLTFEPGSTTWIVGDNGQGKTSLFEAIRMVLGGEAEIPSQPLRIGADKGNILIVVRKDNGEEAFTAERTFTEKGTYLKVTLAGKALPGGPQSFLNQFRSSMCFDAGKFADSEDKERLDILLRVSTIPIDLAATDRRIAELREDRVATHRVRERAKKNAGPGPGAEPIPPDTSAIEREWAAAQRAEQERADTNLRLNAAKIAREDLQKRIDALVAEAKREDERIAGLVNNSRIPLPDIEGIRARHVAAMDEKSRTQAKRDEWLRMKMAADAVAQAEKEYEAADAAVKAAEKQRADALAQAQFPIPSLCLTYSEDGKPTICVRGRDNSVVPFSQKSQAERLIISYVVMARMPNNRLRLALIRDGNALDTKARENIAKIGRKLGFETLIERVAQDVAGAVVIEDGGVKATVPGAAS